MPTLADYGEDRLVAALLARLPAPVLTGPDILAGAGDDCAVVRPAGNVEFVQLLKTDCVIEGVHYTPDTEPERVGWKALCRPLSDLAAMGGTPLHALVTLALPGHTEVAYAEAIYTGLGRAAERFGVKIVGGETARSPSVGFVSVVLTGTAAASQLVLRTGGRAGHRIYVTGRLGGSLVSGKHLDFCPRLDEARWLTEHFPVSAMMDLSDGLAHDLPRLATASSTGYCIFPEFLPCTGGCSEAEAMSDGEDYELLFTLPPEFCSHLERQWQARWHPLELTRLGELTAPTERKGLAGATGYDHFQKRQQT